MAEAQAQPQAGDAFLRCARRIKDAILWIGMPLLGVGFIAILKAAGVSLPDQAQGYSGAQLAGFIALALLATFAFLVGPWIVIFWHVRQERRRRADSQSRQKRRDDR